MTTHWRDLIVYEADGEVGRLGSLDMETTISVLHNATWDDGLELAGYFLAAPGEAPDWDTPKGSVDWN